MYKLIKRFVCPFIVTTMIITNIGSIQVSAMDQKDDQTISIKTAENIEERAVTDGAQFWQVDSKSDQGIVYGSWRNGTSGGPNGTVTMNITFGTNIQVSNTISGSYSSVADVSAGIGVSIGVTSSRSASYSMTAPGRRIRIVYRPYYIKYKVVQNQYTRLDGRNYKTGASKTSYVQVFQNWDYSYNYI